MVNFQQCIERPAALREGGRFVSDILHKKALDLSKAFFVYFHKKITHDE